MKKRYSVFEKNAKWNRHKMPKLHSIQGLEGCIDSRLLVERTLELNLVGE